MELKIPEDLKDLFGDHLAGQIEVVRFINGKRHKTVIISTLFALLIKRIARAEALNVNLTNTHNTHVLINARQSSEIRALEAELATARQSKDIAYSERDRLVCLISKLFPSHLERHPDSDTSWDDDWRWIVFVQLPTGQASWHIHDSELAWFDHLERTDGNTWDGHTTGEKYCRIERIQRIEEMETVATLRESNRRLSAPVSDNDYFDHCILGASKETNAPAAVFNRIIASRQQSKEGPP